LLTLERILYLVCGLSRCKVKCTIRQFTNLHDITAIAEIVKGENHPNWNGGSSTLPYPFGFNKVLKENIKKERIAAVFKYNPYLINLGIYELIKTKK
jgi:hypothetical protein